MRSVIQKIVSLFKVASVTASNDAPDLRGGTFFYLGKSINGTLWTPYGFIHNPPDGSFALVWSQNGHESNAIGIADAPQLRPLRNLAKGECAVVNYLTGAYFYLKENGDIEIDAPSNINVDLTGAATFNTSGATVTIDSSGVTVTGGDVVADGISLKTHVHGGVDPGAGNTGAPV